MVELLGLALLIGHIPGVNGHLSKGAGSFAFGQGARIDHQDAVHNLNFHGDGSVAPGGTSHPTKIY